MLRHALRRAAIPCALLIAASHPAFAEEEHSFETYVTVDYSTHSAAFANSTVWSPFEAVEQTGFRLKIGGLTTLDGGGKTNVFSSSFIASDVTTLATVMAGYQLNWDDIWIKLYAGGAYQTRTYLFWQIGQFDQQKNYGAAVSIETYWQAECGFWTSANVSWLQFDNETSFYGRAAYKIVQDYDGLIVSLGAESGAMIKDASQYRDGKRLDLYDEYVRGGALLNMRYEEHDLSLSGGLAKDTDDGGWRPYGMISYGLKF